MGVQSILNYQVRMYCTRLTQTFEYLIGQVSLFLTVVQTVLNLPELIDWGEKAPNEKQRQNQVKDVEVLLQKVLLRYNVLVQDLVQDVLVLVLVRLQIQHMLVRKGIIWSCQQQSVTLVLQFSLF